MNAFVCFLVRECACFGPQKLTGSFLADLTVRMYFRCIQHCSFMGLKRIQRETCDGELLLLPSCTARKQEIIKITEQLIEAINNGDFEAYA